MGETVKAIQDKLARPLRDLRISVTDRCNFRCRYCMPEELFGPDFKFLPRERLMSFEEITRLIRCFVPLGVEKIRITGGEPLLRKDIDILISMIREKSEVKDIAMTTNGSLLAKFADKLIASGLDRVTVSLDSLNQETFGKMNGVNYQVSDILEGIDK
ncbi:MAG: radical SAM protein, partial [Bacilli bacterium]